MTRQLYHYTCSCSLEKIRASGWLLTPNRLAPLVGLPVLVWLTDMEQPNKLALGLTSFSIPCDRTEYQLTIPDFTGVLPWSAWCRANGFTRAQRDRLEVPGPYGNATGTQPRRWFVTPDPIRCDPA